MLLPGRIAVPERIRNQAQKYQRCLEEADGVWARRRQFDVSHMAGFLERLTNEQLRDALAEVD